VKRVYRNSFCEKGRGGVPIEEKHTILSFEERRERKNYAEHP